MESKRKRRESDTVARGHQEHPREERKQATKKLRKQHRVGNFRSYYEYRLGTNQGSLLAENDPRLAALDQSWFTAKRGLDVGCNAGAMTIAIAKGFAPLYILGVDIDAQLVSKARATLKEYIQKQQVENAFKAITSDTSGKDDKTADEDSASEATGNSITSNNLAEAGAEMPLSFRLWKPPVTGNQPVPKSLGKTATSSEFPYNVVFKCENIVKDSHAGKDYDFITCFSVTKWIHLFHGDEGIKRLFFHLYGLLAPGGRLLLEPQPWKSYHKRKFTSEITIENYSKIQLRPKDFPTFLTETVGFKSCTFLQVCETSSKGFKRPIYVVEKE